MEGSFRKRGKTYELVVSDGYYFDEIAQKNRQRRHYRTIKAKNDTEAEKQLILFHAEILNAPLSGNERPNPMTLADFFPYWVENYFRRKKLSNKHLERCTGMFNDRIKPAMGHRLLSEINPRMINRFLTDLQRPGMRRDGKTGSLSDRTTEMHFSLLRSLLNAAVKWKFIAENPCTSVDKPVVRYDPRSIDVYDFPELAAFLNTMDADPEVPLKYKVFAHLALHTSCRRGEIIGLSWDAVDFTAETIDIFEAAEYIVGQPITKKTTKTRVEAAKPVSGKIMALLRQLKDEEAARRKKLGKKWHESGSVFTQRDGRTMHVNTYYTWLRKFAKKHKLKKGGPQCLRHTSATQKFYIGVTAEDVKDDLGHTSLRTTNRYIHKLRSTSKNSSDMMSKHMENLLASNADPAKDSDSES